MWLFGPKREPTPPKLVTERDGFKVGDVVYHKIDGRKRVVVGFEDDDDFSVFGTNAICAWSSKAGDEWPMRTAELTLTEPVSRASGAGTPTP